MSEAFDRKNPQNSGSVPPAVLTDRSAPARASVVNRTHRVVRERAKSMAARRSRFRSLWIPLAVCSSLLVIICTAVWTALDAYDVTPSGVPDASNQFLVLCLWFLPVSMALLAVVLFQRARKREVVQ
ncbi:MAG TPA: hypothetical protein VGG81_02450 [Edaphobacter sp.]|jgi:hypothetical protein